MIGDLFRLSAVPTNFIGSFLNRSFERTLQPGEVFQLHGHSPVGLQFLLVAKQEVPIEGRKGTGIVFSRLGWIESAFFAVVCHALNVLA